MTGVFARHSRRALTLAFVTAGAISGTASLQCTSVGDRGDRTGRSDRTASEHVATTRSAFTWGGALAPIRIRAGHTTTLLGTGGLLVAGGGSTPRSTELLDPYSGTVTLGPDMTVSRVHHTATVLGNGKVLLAGGGSADAELFDPVTRTFAPTAPMSKPRTSHSAVRLRDGRVLVVGGESAGGTAELYDPAKGTWAPTSARVTTGGTTMVTLATGKVLFRGTQSAEIFDPAAASGAGAWSTAPASPPLATVGASVITRARDGRLFTAAGDGCALAGFEACFGKVWMLDVDTGVGNPVGSFVFGRTDPVAALLPSGDIVYAGGRPMDSVKTAELVTVGPPDSIATDGPTALGHLDATSVVLPGGDVLVIGGTQATIDRRSYVGKFHDSAGPMVTPRIAHTAVRLHDGRLMISGGGTSAQVIAPVITSIELFDPTTDLFTAGGDLSVPRTRHTATTLASGKVLITGGATATPVTIHASAEIYDPTAAIGARSHAVGALSKARMNHAATLLPSGEVLVTGGCTAKAQVSRTCAADGASKVAELFDPVTETFVVLPAMNTAREDHGAVVLPNGKVLIVGGGDATAEIYDPLTKTFKLTQPSGSPRDGRTAHLLPSGRVFVAGGATLAPDIFDPVTETWSFAAAIAAQFPEMLWATKPDGRLVSAGGLLPLDGLSNTQTMFDPLATSPQTASFVQVATENNAARESAALTLAGTGELVLSGGSGCHGACIASPSPLASIHDDGAPLGARPIITAVPAVVTGGSKVEITGSGFANGPEGSGGTQASSATNHPLALWVSDVGDAVVPGTILDFTDTTATWLVPATALQGHGLLFISSGGVLSYGASVTINPAGAAVPCGYDAECGTGFCVDGVCCDRRCDGKCDGCSAKRKTSGEDGVCGPVPPGRDIAGRCFSQLGVACKDGLECTTGFCAQGVCCDSTCTGQCQACNQADRPGICSPIMEGACGAACDGDHTLKQTGAPDVDCAPFKCEGPRCKTTCASVKDCAAPFVCSLDGQCTAPTDPTAGTGGVCGCKVVGNGGGSGSSGMGALALGVVALVTRARRRKNHAGIGGGRA
ncbi:MAG: Branched-chain amino acid transporter, amino acid-binding protein [Myxococcaceae bacterium]|nr:Branched-chain amino acid transporter, amino acid-binding protein [Myxococcaceae bacterium]